MLGINCKLFYQSGGTYAAPTWVEVDCVGDLQLSPVWDAAEVMTRASRVKMSEKTMMGIEVTTKMLARFSGSTPYEYLRDAMLSDLRVDFLVINGVISGASANIGAWGFRFHGQVFQAVESQNPGDRVQDDIVIRPCVPAVAAEIPKYAEVTAGPALTFTTIGTAPI